MIQDVAAGYDAKRDCWNGYDPSEHKRIYEEYAAIESARQKIREEEIDKQTTTDLAAVRKVAKASKGEGADKEGDPDFGSSEEEDEDEEKYADAADAVGQKLDTKTRITVRNLRIREDTAKYLINLDPESAYYDPKTRSMRDAPMKNVATEDVRRFLRETSYAILTTYSHRPNLPVTTSSDTQERLPTCKSYNSSPGNLPLVGMMFTCKQTQRKARSCISSTKIRKKSCEIRRRSGYWRSMVENSI